MSRISSFSIAISCSNTSRSLLAARYPDEPIDSASATMPARPATSDRVLRRLEIPLGADHAGHQAEVGGQSVVEAVDHVAEEAAGAGLVPGLARRPAHLGQGLGVLLRLLGQPERGRPDRAVRLAPVEVQVAFDLAPLLLRAASEAERRCPAGGPARP